MRPIKIHIKRLGLIKDSNLEISPLMIFSGESGLGKSYVAILCHYFFSVWLNEKRLDSFIRKYYAVESIDFFDTTTTLADSGIALELKKTDLEQWLAENAIEYLSYMLGCDKVNAEISINLPPEIADTIVFQYDRELMGIDKNEDLYWKLSVMHLTYRFRQLGIKDESPYSYVLRFAMIAELFGSDYMALTMAAVLPPSRGSFFTEDITPKTGLFITFADTMKGLEQANEIPDVISEDCVRLYQSLMDGQVKKNGDKYTYTTNHGDIIPITAAASSVREMAPLQLLVTKRDIKKIAVLIEEPESHLHPLKQRLIADAVVAMATNGAMMQITTHSDYFLRRINDLLRLHIIKRRKSDVEYKELCKELDLEPTLTLDPDLLAAYYLERQQNGDVRIIHQNTSNGIPFDTLREINGKPLTDSAKLYEIALDL